MASLWGGGIPRSAEAAAFHRVRAPVESTVETSASRGGPAADTTETGRFEKVVLTGHVTDPMEISVAPDETVFIAERSGPIKKWDPASGATRMVGYIPVRMTIEDGLMGLTLDPGFAENGRMYVYYAPVDGGPQRLSRLTFDGTDIDMGSEKILLEIPTQQEKCCHSAGSLAFGPDGTLYLATGDNTDPYPLGGSPIDERPGRAVGDAQRTSANTNDLRGKILRIRPLDDGTYEIPEGNLFPGDSLHRPEIYVMGNRNPYRIAVDPKTGWLYWGDVGIGNSPSEDRGPWGWEEFNQAREAGFYGWPYFAGPNDAYRDYDYESEKPGPFFDPTAPVNDSPNNTGARQLPPSRPAMVWYTYGPSEEFPALGAGGMSAMGGPVYRYDSHTASPHALPPEYDGSWIVYEWMRHWLLNARLDENGDLIAIEPFLPGVTFVRPTDVEVGPDGRLYVAEWGETFWGSNHDAQIVRIDYHAAQAEASAARGDLSNDVAERHADAADAHPSESSPVIIWPPDGGIFHDGAVIEYEVSVTGSDAEAEGVVVRSLVGHDTHEHPLRDRKGPHGTFIAERAYKHVPDLHLMDEFFVLEARRHDDQGTGPLENVGSQRDVETEKASQRHRVVLQPRRKQAEHFSAQSGAERETLGKHPAEPDFAHTAMTVMILDDGGYLSYDPINLVNIDSVKFRLKAEQSGTIEIRADAADGPFLGSIFIDTTVSTAEADLPDVAPVEMTDEALTEIPGDVRAAYEGWREITVPIKDPGGTRALRLSFRGEGKGRLMLLDWIEFRGPGITRRTAR